MFSDLILRNSRRSRKENGLFFGSLIISIVAFYIILSLSHQDVMLFLREMESDAVNRLLLIVPVFYVMTLGILFFLIYFACKYQLQRRRHEFGVYLMLGMRRSRLFFMLLAEDLVGSVLALLIGLPVAVLLSELISLTTAKLVGMGIIGHRFTLSLSAVALTIIGFLVIKLAAFLMLSGSISQQEIGTLLADAPAKAKKQKPAVVYGLSAAAGGRLCHGNPGDGMAVPSDDAGHPAIGDGGNDPPVFWYADPDCSAGPGRWFQQKAPHFQHPPDPGECHSAVHRSGRQLPADSGGTVLFWRRDRDFQHQQSSRRPCAGLYVRG